METVMLVWALFFLGVMFAKLVVEVRIARAKTSRKPKAKKPIPLTIHEIDAQLAKTTLEDWEAQYVYIPGDDGAAAYKAWAARILMPPEPIRYCSSTNEPVSTCMCPRHGGSSYTDTFDRVYMYERWQKQQARRNRPPGAPQHIRNAHQQPLRVNYGTLQALPNRENPRWTGTATCWHRRLRTRSYSSTTLTRGRGVTTRTGANSCETT